MNKEQQLENFQIIYASAATGTVAASEMRELLAIARKNNHSVRVSGILVYHDHCFLQVLEGPRIAVEAIFNRVCTDPRHEDVTVLLQKPIEQKSFEDWSMAFVDATEQAENLAGFVNYLDELEAKAVGQTQAHRVLRGFQEGNWRQHMKNARAGAA